MSRREAARAIAARFIKVNGRSITETGIKINPETDTVTISPAAQKQLEQKETVLVYKPRGFLSSKDTDGGKTIFDTFPEYKKLNCVGRLDKDSEGLILLSDDGLITKALTGKDHLIEKEYEVTVREDILPHMIKKMHTGIRLRDGMSQAVSAEKIDKHTFGITLREGRKHQIRRMANALHLTVTSLKRIRIGHLTIKQMRPGQSRPLKPKDIEKLKSALI